GRRQVLGRFLGRFRLRRHLLGCRRHGFAGIDRLALDLRAPAPAGALGASVAAAGTAVGLRLGGALGALVLGDQRLPVGNRDLIVVGMDFAEGQEAVGVGA